MGGKVNLFVMLLLGCKLGLVLLGYIDVVFVDGQFWELNLFEVQICDGCLYGCGMVDMKSFIVVVFVNVFVFMVVEGDVSFYFLLLYDEEIGCVGVCSLLCDLEVNGIQFVGCIVGEFMLMCVIIVYKGKCEY